MTVGGALCFRTLCLQRQLLCLTLKLPQSSQFQAVFQKHGLYVAKPFNLDTLNKGHATYTN